MLLQHFSFEKQGEIKKTTLSIGEDDTITKTSWFCANPTKVST
jgi:hypothetical protein